MVANEDTQTSSIASIALDSWATTPSRWRHPSEIEFRVRRRGQPTRRLRLPGARYTLGSGTGCSIPLEDPSLRPLHAVLIRDEERILVRAYSVPFQINNDRVTEGLLSAGDRLRLGAYEFELLDTALDAANTVPPETSQGGSGDEVPCDAEQDAWSKSFHEEAKQWRALKQDTQRREEWCETRERELQEQEASLTEKMETLRAREENLQTQESAAAEVRDEFLQHYQELLGHRADLKRQQEELATGREHLRLQQDRLDGRDRLHRQQLDKLIGEQEQFKRAEVISQKRLAESEEQLQLSRQQAETATSAVAQMREKFTSLSEQLKQLSQHQASLQQLEIQRNREHQHQTEELELARDEALAQCDYVSAQCDNVTAQRDEIASQRDELAVQRDELLAERDDIAIERDDVAMERDEIKTRCQELELIQTQLRLEIEELQGEIARTRMDAETLEQECWEARHTISDLEDTIRDQDDRYETDRESWTSEVDALRKNIDELSLDLETAQAQLAQLREENTRLADQLIGATAERDEARAEREAAMEQCQVAQQACDSAKTDCETARRELETARFDVKIARQERDDAAAIRDQLVAQLQEQTANQDELTQQHEELATEKAAWAEQKLNADRRYQEARAHLADAREKCERAVRARDEADAARLAAEEKLAIATADLQAMQAERDLAIAGQDDLRRQRDHALQDAKDTRELFDRSNRDHDDTLELIERLEQKTREVMGAFESEHPPVESPRLSLLDHEIQSVAAADAELNTPTELAVADDTPTVSSTSLPSGLSEPLDTDDAWPTYTSTQSEPETELEDDVATVLGQSSVSEACEEAATASSDETHPVDESINAPLEIAQLKISLPVVATDDQASETAAPAEDDSIEAYMNRLLQRVQGRITEAVPHPAQSELEDAEEPEQLSIAATNNAAAHSTIQFSDYVTDRNDGPTTPSPVEKVAATTEQPSGPSVRSVATRHPKSTTQSTFKFAQTAIALLCGLAAVVLVTLPMLKMVAAAAAVLIAVISAKEAIALRTTVIRPSSVNRASSKNDVVARKAAA